MLGFAATGVIVEQRRRLGKGDVVVHAQILEGWLPFAVRGLVLDHQEKWLSLISLATEPVESVIGDDVGDVADLFDFLAVALHRRVVINALAVKDLPEIKTRGIGFEMPFSNQRGLIAGRSK